MGGGGGGEGFKVIIMSEGATEVVFRHTLWCIAVVCSMGLAYTGSVVLYCGEHNNSWWLCRYYCSVPIFEMVRKPHVASTIKPSKAKSGSNTRMIVDK